MLLIGSTWITKTLELSFGNDRIVLVFVGTTLSNGSRSVGRALLYSSMVLRYAVLRCKPLKSEAVRLVTRYYIDIA